MCSFAIKTLEVDNKSLLSLTTAGNIIYKCTKGMTEISGDVHQLQRTNGSEFQGALQNGVRGLVMSNPVSKSGQAFLFSLIVKRKFDIQRLAKSV